MEIGTFYSVNSLLNITIEQLLNIQRDQLMLNYITIPNKFSFRTIYNSHLDSTFNENINNLFTEK